MNALTKDFTDAVEQQFAKLNKDVQDALTEAKTASGIIFDMEQKIARRGGGEGVPLEQKSLGDQFIERAEGELKAFAEDHSRPGRLRMELKTTITTDATSAGAAAGPAYRDSIVGIPQRQLRVRNLLPVIGITTGEFEFARQTVRENNANTVAEGTLKPESAYGWEMDRGTPKVIAHWVPASRQILDDAPQLSGLIDTELRYGLSLKEDAQILAGDGQGQNLSGLIPNATPYAAPFTPEGATMLDTVGLGMLQTTLADFLPTGVVMHPSDWMRIRLLKNADGEYLLGDPGAAIAPLLFGLPVVATTSMPIDKFLIGAFPQAATIYDRWAPRVEVSTEHADFFTRNLVAILCEQRLGLAVKQPKALVFGGFGNVA